MTSEQKAGLARLLLRLPFQRGPIRQFALTAAGRDCCESYELAWVAEQFWARSLAKHARDIHAEYQALIIELEDEAKLNLHRT